MMNDDARSSSFFPENTVRATYGGWKNTRGEIVEQGTRKSQVKKERDAGSRTPSQASNF